MPSREDIRHQLQLLEINRRNMRQYMKQVSLVDIHSVSTGIQNGIKETRDNINQIKNILFDWGVTYSNKPEDDYEIMSAPNTRATSVKIDNITDEVVLMLPQDVYDIIAMVLKKYYSIHISQYKVN